MKKIMILTENNIVKNSNGQITPTLSNLKDHVKKEEMNYDIIAYFEKGEIIFLKNRIGTLDHIELGSKLTNLFCTG